MTEETARLPLHYLHAVVAEDGGIAAIVSLDLWDPAAAVVVRKAYGHKRGERGILSDFCKQTHFFNRKWDFIPCGAWLDLSIAALWEKAKKYGLMDAFEDRNGWHKPAIDLGALAVLANGGQFRGATLQHDSNRGASIPRMLATGQDQQAEAAMVADALAFKDLFHRLIDRAPALIRSS